MPSSLNTEELEPKAIDPGPNKIIGPGFDYGTVTDKIANVVLQPIERTPKQWWISLFLAFVAATVIPLVILAIVIRTYFAAQLRAGTAEAAAKTALVAQRLVEDYATLPAGARPLAALDDQVMALVRRAIDEDVNLFERAQLQATSERDLFESGLLPVRTPADVYRRIVLDRLPTFVREEAGYLLAAAPVRAGGREGVLVNVDL